ncbi:MAG: GNAT family N-acetyltransferase [Desulfobacterales bacterium]|nr:GNAT family N-acetyltransferase [Desulfobacterales bacterium]
MLEIKLATDEDFVQIWPIIHEILRTGDTYPFAPETTRDEAFQIWMKKPKATYAALLDDQLVGTYYIKANQPGLGSHVCNCGYMVGAAARGKGIGRAMCQHSLVKACKLGFKAMQYNLVVSTNTGAVKLWQDLGFDIVGTLPKAFHHHEKGFIDAFVMYQWLDEK